MANATLIQSYCNKCGKVSKVTRKEGWKRAILHKGHCPDCAEIKSYFKPNYSNYSIVNIPSLVADHFNINSSKPLSDKFTKSYLDGCEQIVLILIDGFGYNLALEYLKDITFKKIEQNSMFIPITSTFPSTTTTALSSVNTGKTPQEHGVVGHTMYSQKFGTVVNMMRFRSVIESYSDSLIRAGFNPETYIRSPTIYETLSNDMVLISLHCLSGSERHHTS